MDAAAERAFLSDFRCCDTALPDLHALFAHHEAFHQKDGPSFALSPPSPAYSTVSGTSFSSEVGSVSDFSLDDAYAYESSPSPFPSASAAALSFTARARSTSLPMPIFAPQPLPAFTLSSSLPSTPSPLGEGLGRKPNRPVTSSARNAVTAAYLGARRVQTGSASASRASHDEPAVPASCVPTEVEAAPPPEPDDARSSAPSPSPPPSPLSRPATPDPPLDPKPPVYHKGALREYICPVSTCCKAYTNPGGLRYHLTRGWCETLAGARCQPTREIERAREGARVEDEERKRKKVFGKKVVGKKALRKGDPFDLDVDPLTPLPSSAYTSRAASMVPSEG
ncbi:hypothetical protein MKEN_00161600 [Mycena kentingensis (nom. inval.)]|nr:hypothetical protein MKEN_00161600 [Mycena kentingensis (nom. inval.)]